VALATQSVLYNQSLSPTYFDQGDNNFVLDATAAATFVNKLGIFQVDFQFLMSDGGYNGEIWVDINCNYVDTAGAPQTAIQVKLGNTKIAAIVG